MCIYLEKAKIVELIKEIMHKSFIVSYEIFGPLGKFSLVYIHGGLDFKSQYLLIIYHTDLCWT